MTTLTFGGAADFGLDRVDRPVGVDQLTTFKYRIRGSGQTRP